jgi:DNA repair exonuclease SbcCD ATPase subunit
MERFSCTRVLSGLERLETHCNVCKSFELWKLHACKERCLADDLIEQRMVANKFKSELPDQFENILCPHLEHTDTLLSSKCDKLEKKVKNFRDMTQVIPRLQRELESLSKREPKISTKSAEVANFTTRLKLMSERLNTLEDNLNTAAANVYNLKERTTDYLEEPTPKVPIDSLHKELESLSKVVSSDIYATEQLKFRHNEKKLEEKMLSKKFIPQARMRDQRLSDMQQVQRNLARQRESMNDKLEKLKSIQGQLYDKLKSDMSCLRDLKISTKTLKEEQENTQLLDPRKLVDISNYVLSFNSKMKRCKEMTMDYLTNQMSSMQEFPQLHSRMEKISQQISHLT